MNEGAVRAQFTILRRVSNLLMNEIACYIAPQLRYEKC